jgi:hypothetical protein
VYGAVPRAEAGGKKRAASPELKERLVGSLDFALGFSHGGEKGAAREGWTRRGEERRANSSRLNAEQSVFSAG